MIEDVSANARQIYAMILAIRPQSAPKDLGPDEDLWEQRLLDSFAVVHLIFKLEDSFGIALDFPDVNAENFRSVNSILHLLSRKYGVGDAGQK